MSPDLPNSMKYVKNYFRRKALHKYFYFNSPLVTKLLSFISFSQCDENFHRQESMSHNGGGSKIALFTFKTFFQITYCISPV